MRKILHFGLIACHSLLLDLKGRLYIEESIGLEAGYQAMERSIGGRGDLKRVEVANRMAFDRAGGSQHRPMRNEVVHVKIGTTVRENSVRSMSLDQFLHDFNHVEKREGVEAIVRQVVQEQVFDVERISSAPGVVVQTAYQGTIGQFAGRVTGRQAFTQDGDLDVVAFRTQPSHGSTAAEDLVIRVGRDHQDAAQIVSRDSV